MNCWWTIPAVPNRFIVITFNSFDTEENGGSIFRSFLFIFLDFVTVYDVNSLTSVATNISRLSGSLDVPFDVSSTKVLIFRLYLNR